MIRRLLAITALCLSIILTAAACGSSDSDKDSTTTTTEKSDVTAQTAPTTAAPKMPNSFSGGNKSTYCKEWASLVAASAGVSTESDAIKAKYTKVVEVAKRMLAAAPDEIKDDVQTAIEIAQKAAETGSLSPFDTDESKKVGSRIAAYNNKQCPSSTSTTVK